VSHVYVRVFALRGPLFVCPRATCATQAQRRVESQCWLSRPVHAQAYYRLLCKRIHTIAQWPTYLQPICAQHTATLLRYRHRPSNRKSWNMHASGTASSRPGLSQVATKIYRPYSRAARGQRIEAFTHHDFVTVARAHICWGRGMFARGLPLRHTPHHRRRAYSSVHAL
jgi:hypothetical protein